jgi:hypothetical protein
MSEARLRWWQSHLDRDESYTDLWACTERAREYIAELETEVARLDRMLRLAWFDFTSGDEPIMPNTIDDWLADLKARAEEGSE